VRGTYSNFFTPSLFQRGKLTSPPFGVFLLPEAGKGRQGGIFKALKYSKYLCFENSNLGFARPVK
jgi:hypothetical protein